MKHRITITLPLPNTHLQPNSRPHWRTKAAAVKAYRSDAKHAALAAWIEAGGRANEPWPEATVTATFFWPTRRRRDKDNALASLKAALDGLFDAGVIADDEHLTPLPVEFGHDALDPRVELCVVRDDVTTPTPATSQPDPHLSPKPSKKKTPKRKPKPKAPPADDALAWITPDLRPLAIAISDVAQDPKNARTHDDPNIQAIKTSLAQFGQRKPIVVNRANNQVEAGNGTLVAAHQLGHTHIAAVWVEDDETTQTGYALADNRTAELAAWDDERLAEAIALVEATSRELYDDLLLDELAAGGEEDEEAAAEEQHVPEDFAVVVDCRDQADQETLYERLTSEGYTCRVLTT